MTGIFQLWRCVLVLSIIVWAGSSMADATKEKFSLIAAQSEANAVFDFEDTDLSFTTTAPGDFVWNESKEIPTEFVKAALFSELTERAIGYDPLNRDRFEVRIYTGKIFPDRVLLAVDYATMFATSWGKTNFGEMAHSAEFGEVLGGTDASGLMIVNRITVFRRGDEILVIRSKFHAEHFETYASAIATLVGSVAFVDAAKPDSISQSLLVRSNPIGPAAPNFEYKIPAHWTHLASEHSPDGTQSADAWIDPSDASQSTALMVFTKSPPVRSDPYVVDPQTMANLSFSMAEVALNNLLPSPDFKLTPIEKSTFNAIYENAAFNGLFVFKGEVGPEKNLIKVSVLLSSGDSGATIGSVVVSPIGPGQYILATSMVGRYVQKLQLDAQTAFWTALKQEEGQ